MNGMVLYVWEGVFISLQALLAFGHWHIIREGTLGCWPVF